MSSSKLIFFIWLNSIGIFLHLQLFVIQMQFSVTWTLFVSRKNTLLSSLSELKTIILNLCVSSSYSRSDRAGGTLGHINDNKEAFFWKTWGQKGSVLLWVSKPSGFFFFFVVWLLLTSAALFLSCYGPSGLSRTIYGWCSHFSKRIEWFLFLNASINDCFKFEQEILDGKLIKK